MKSIHAESFTAMVIADVLRTAGLFPDLVASVVAALERKVGVGDRFFFFDRHELLPADADCTALGFSLLLQCGSRIDGQAHQALDLILDNAHDGIVQTYFDPTGERDGIIDPVVCINTLYLAFQLGRSHQITRTFDYVCSVLLDRAYLNGTRYYHSPDSFLYFLGRLVYGYPETRRHLRRPLCSALKDRQGASLHTIDLAQRILLSSWLDVADGGDLNRLIDVRERSGGWPADSLFRYGRKRIFFGSHSVASAFAVAALASQPAFTGFAAAEP